MDNRTVFEREGEFEAAAPLRVDKVMVVWKQDEHPDTSWLGEYTSTWKEGAIDRKKKGDWERGQHLYFIPGNDYAECSPKDRAKYIAADYRRMERLNRGDWCFVGCVAAAEVSFPQGQGSRRTQMLNSGGIWGIESDSNESCVADIEAQELADLASVMEAFGVELPEELQLPTTGSVVNSERKL